MKFGFGKTTVSFKNMLWMLGEHAFLCILVLIGVAFLISTLLFYLYVFPAQVRPTATPEIVLKFRMDVFGEVVENWKNQDEKFDQAYTLAPRNIFRYNPNASKSP